MTLIPNNSSQAGTELEQPAKTFWQYWKLVWRTGRQIEGSDWIKKTCLDLFVIAVVLFILWIILGSTAVEARTPTTIASLIGFVVLGIRRFIWSMVQAPFKIYSEQQNAFKDLKESSDRHIAFLMAERDEATSNKHKKPVQKVEIQHLLESFANWLAKERENPSLTSEQYLTLVNEVSEGLSFKPVTISRDATTVLAALRQLKEVVMAQYQRVVGGEFNREWQPPDWLREIVNNYL